MRTPSPADAAETSSGRYWHRGGRGYWGVSPSGGPQTPIYRGRL